MLVMNSPETIAADALTRMGLALDQARHDKISPVTLIDRLGRELRTVLTAGLGIGNAGFYAALGAYEAKPNAAGLTGLGKALIALRTAVVHSVAEVPAPDVAGIEREEPEAKGT